MILFELQLYNTFIYRMQKKNPPAFPREGIGIFERRAIKRPRNRPNRWTETV